MMRHFSYRPGYCILLLLTSCAPEKNVNPEINKEYKNTKVEVWAERFEKPQREVFRDREAIVDALALRPGMSVGDVGAGTGLFTEIIARRVGPRGRVYAVDVVPEFIEHIRQRIAAAGLTNVETILCKQDSTSLPAHSVDLVFLCDTYHHFEFPRSTIHSIHHALRPNGELFVVDYIRKQGVSTDWVMNHVRAGQEVFTAEIESCGFERLPDTTLKAELKENYVMHFRKRG
jgi:ubiquinone/menaquinone biosynthesis C-methylase UbiE